MHFGEALRFSLQALRGSPVRSLLTCLGMLIGNASVILVVTISQTSQDYILEQIRGLGSNIVYAFFETGSQGESSARRPTEPTRRVAGQRSSLRASGVAFCPMTAQNCAPPVSSNARRTASAEVSLTAPTSV